MTRSELIHRLSSRFPQLRPEDAEISVNAILSAIAGALSTGGRAEIRGFGSFSTHTRLPRRARNPMTGEAVMVGAKTTPHFKAGKELRERVDTATK